jgi:hypothetical protein
LAARFADGDAAAPIAAAGRSATGIQLRGTR